MEKIKIIIITIIFLLGLYFIMNTKITQESFKNNYRCPNLLIEKDGNILLYNTKLAIVPGVNPILFNNLEEYIEFMDWQKSNNIKCPILHLKYSTDTQNNEKLQIKPDFLNNYSDLPNERSKTLDVKVLDIGESELIDSSRDNELYNQNLYQGFDKHNQYIGLYTPLDKIYHSDEKISPNPLDTNWGGIEYTQSKVDRGDYSDRYVYKNNNTK